MKLNKKIFFILLLLALIIPQTAFAIDDNSNLNGNLALESTDLNLCSSSVDDSINANDMDENGLLDEVSNGYSNGDSSLDAFDSNLNLDDSSSISASDSNSKNSNANNMEDNTYFVSENIESQFEKLNLNDLEELNLIGAECSDMDSDIIDESCCYDGISENTLNEGPEFNVFIISDTTGNNLFDAVACEILGNSSFSNVKFNIRSGDQIKNMSEEEIYDLMDSCDAFIGQWVSSNVDAVLTSLLGKYPDLSNKALFLILEPPSGNINSGSSSIGLVRNNTINYQKIFSSISTDDLVSYFKNTKRGTAFNDVYNYIASNGSSFGEIYNNFVLYKDINDKSNLKNELLYLLNLLGQDCEFEAPNFTGVQLSGIFRDRWYSLDEYIATFFNSSNKRTIGILESTLYIQSQQLDVVNEITESLESMGYNVIPIYSAAGNAEQLNIMVKYWTSAGSNVSGFIENPLDFDIYVDAIISMVAYGVGGENFTNATNFFENANVPVFRAVHSDYLTNAQWELSPTGLTTTKSDKWWHITISESQGIFDATFVGENICSCR